MHIVPIEENPPNTFETLAEIRAWQKGVLWRREYFKEQLALTEKLCFLVGAVCGFVLGALL